MLNKNPYADQLPKKLKEFVAWEDNRVKEAMDKMSPEELKKLKAAQNKHHEKTDI